MPAKDKNTDDQLEQHFRGKQQMRPLFDELIKTVKKVDPKVKIVALASQIDLHARDQFGLVRVRKHSVELGLHLPDTPPNDRYRDATALNLGRITHLARITDTKDLDASLRKDIRKAIGASR